MEKSDCGLSASDIDRAHRVGPKKPVKGSSEVTGIKQQMIVKFMSFRRPHSCTGNGRQLVLVLRLG